MGVELVNNASAERSRNAIVGLLDSFSGSGRNLLRRYLPFAATGTKQGKPEATAAMLADLAGALLSVRGEASGVAIATDLLALYD